MRRAVIILALVLGSAAGAFAEPPHHGEHEIIYTRPSGFWTSNAPATNGAYKWRLVGVGCVVGALTGWLLFRTIKRANAERDARAAMPEAKIRTP